MKRSWIYRYQVTGGTHEDLQAAVSAEWQKYRNDPTAELPWNTQIEVATGTVEKNLGGDVIHVTYTADVTVQWQD